METPIKTDPNVLEPIYEHFEYLKDYPLELRGSFIEDAVSIGALQADQFLGFAMAYRVEEERLERDHFPFLSEEENLSLNRYRHIRPVQAWPQPTIGVGFNAKGEGRVTGTRYVDVVLKVIGNAQVWYGSEVAVLWEAYIEKHIRTTPRMVWLWDVLERYLAEQGVKRVLTYASDPEFEEGWYKDFLASRGYERDPKRAHLKAGEVAVMKLL